MHTHSPSKYCPSSLLCRCTGSPWGLVETPCLSGCVSCSQNSSDCCCIPSGLAGWWGRSLISSLCEQINTLALLWRSDVAHFTSILIYIDINSVYSVNVSMKLLFFTSTYKWPFIPLHLAQLIPVCLIRPSDIYIWVFVSYHFVRHQMQTEQCVLKRKWITELLLKQVPWTRTAGIPSPAEGSGEEKISVLCRSRIYIE